MEELFGVGSWVLLLSLDVVAFQALEEWEKMILSVGHEVCGYAEHDFDFPKM